MIYIEVLKKKEGELLRCACQNNIHSHNGMKQNLTGRILSDGTVQTTGSCGRYVTRTRKSLHVLKGIRREFCEYLLNIVNAEGGEHEN